MNDPVFLDSAAFLRVWQRVTGEAGITAAPAQPEPDTITAQLRECICEGGRHCLLCRARAACVRRPAAGRTDRSAGARAAQSAANRVFSAHGHALRPPAACPRLSTAAADLRCAYLQELALSAQLGAAADAAPMPLRETLHTMAQQDARHAQRVRTLLTRLIF